MYQGCGRSCRSACQPLPGVYHAGAMQYQTGFTPRRRLTSGAAPAPTQQRRIASTLARTFNACAPQLLNHSLPRARLSSEHISHISGASIVAGSVKKASSSTTRTPGARRSQSETYSRYSPISGWRRGTSSRDVLSAPSKLTPLGVVARDAWSSCGLDGWPG